jgi:DNA polymerase elongation subunit (family B)
MLKSDFVTKYVSKVNDEYFLMDLEFEKDLEYAYFGDSKKRYYGIERTSGAKYIKGLNIIRKDAPKFIKKQLDTLAEHSVKNKISVKHLIALRKKLESVPYLELGITKAFGKPFWSYKKNKPQHLKAALWTNDILNTKITHSDNPLLFYVTSTCQDELKPRDRNTAICVKEEDLDLIDKSKALFKMDYDMFFEKQVLDQLDEFKYIPAVEEALKDYEKTTTVL